MPGPDPDGLPGRVSISERALGSVFAAVAARELGVRRRDVSTRISDDAGRVRVHVTAPAEHDSAGSSLIETGRRARAAIAGDGARIAGVEVGEVEVRISGARESTRGLR